MCSALTLTFILVVVGNLLTIVIFAKNKNIRKKYLFLVVNMAFADLFLGALSLPVYIYDVGMSSTYGPCSLETYSKAVKNC